MYYHISRFQPRECSSTLSRTICWQQCLTIRCLIWLPEKLEQTIIHTEKMYSRTGRKRPYCGLRTVTRGTTVTPFLFQGLPIGAMEDDLAARHRAIAAARTASKATYAMFQDPKTLPTVLAQLFNVCTRRNRVLPSGSQKMSRPT